MVEIKQMEGLDERRSRLPNGTGEYTKTTKIRREANGGVDGRKIETASVAFFTLKYLDRRGVRGPHG
jgi:hypothetical protein